MENTTMLYNVHFASADSNMIIKDDNGVSWLWLPALSCWTNDKKD